MNADKSDNSGKKENELPLVSSMTIFCTCAHKHVFHRLGINCILKI